jgi:tetratricopeptide (TPR) repeat protein
MSRRILSLRAAGAALVCLTAVIAASGGCTSAERAAVRSRVLGPPAEGGQREIFRDGKWVKLGAPSAEADSEALRPAREAAARGDYRGAIRSASPLVDSAPDAATALAARLLIGDCWLLSDEMTDARLSYDAVLAEAPADSPYYEAALERQYEVAWQWLVGGRKRKVKLFGFYLPLIRVSGESEGKRLVDDILANRPSAELAARCAALSAEYLYGRADYDAADLEYQRLAERFRNSPFSGFATSAEMQVANSKLAQYRGVGYDQKPLRDARVAMADFARDHPAEARRRDVATLSERVEWLTARQDYETAEFYRRLGDLRAAIRYYRYVVRDYPDTPWASRSKVRLTALGTEAEEPAPPAEPPAAPAAARPAPPTTVARAAGEDTKRR